MSTVEKRQNYSPEEFFEMDQSAPFHYEYHNGEIFAMAGGTVNHGIIAGNIITALNNRLKDGNCIVTTSDVKLAIQTENAFLHPDAMVICEEIDFYEERKDILQNPVLIIEVLSDSTSGYDRGEKFRKYRNVASLREYVLIEQKKMMVDSFFKNEDGIWTVGAYADSGDLHIRSLQLDIPLVEIYRKVTF